MFGMYKDPQGLFSQDRWMLPEDSPVSICAWSLPMRSSPELTLALTRQASSKHWLAVTTYHQWHPERNGYYYTLRLTKGSSSEAKQYH